MAVEPEVAVIQLNDAKTQISFQVVFKGTDKLSVKFEFNTQTDTAEEVVHEMVPHSKSCSTQWSFIYFGYIKVSGCF